MKERRSIDFFFADDSTHLHPKRPGMDPFVAFGGIRVPAEHLGSLNKLLEELCRKTYRFPAREEFKWSVSRSSWMARKLVGKRRQSFYTDVLELLAKHDVVATVMISTRSKPDKKIHRVGDKRCHEALS